MPPRDEALNLLKKDGSVTSEKLAARLRVSRVYAQRILRDLVREGVLFQIGKTKGVRYVSADQKTLAAIRESRLRIVLHLKNEDLHEEEVLERVEKETGILTGVPKNVRDLFEFGFTEMLNNAIDHSRSERIDVECRRSDTAATFVVRDFGIGIFNNVRETFRFPGTLVAIQELLKGKRTTDREHHTGQGVFFTSKMADVFIVDSFEKTLTVNNLVRDIFISDRKPLIGTRVSFSVNLSSQKTLKAVFDAYTGSPDEDLAFNKTRITVKLFEYGRTLPSRSEAKRVMLNLENFKEVELDFSGVETVGQGFADQIFRVWHTKHPETNVIAVNANENVAFAVQGAGGIVGQSRLQI
jgi:anti-sigma regulatory factor (Ser/Thr protein kinase)